MTTTPPRFFNFFSAMVFCLALLAGAARAAPFAYISNFGSANVSVIDIATNTVVGTVPVGAQPEGVAVNPVSPRVYVTTSSNVSVIDTTSNTVIATVPVGVGPTGVAVNPAGTRAYATNFGSNTVSVIDTASN